MRVAEQLDAALAGRYVIDREIGSGAMAFVFRAHDVRHDRPVADGLLFYLMPFVDGESLRNRHSVALPDAGRPRCNHCIGYCFFTYVIDVSTSCFDTSMSMSSSFLT